jgi:DNA topoisomerase-2
MSFYDKRKIRIVKDLKYTLIKLSNRAKYIQAILRGEIDLRHKTDEQVDQMLETAQFDRWGTDTNYDYLIKMPMNSVTKENAAKILRECDQHEAELREIENTTTTQMWQKDLVKLEREYHTYKQMREKVQQADNNTATRATTTKSTASKPVAAKPKGKTPILDGK